MAIKRTLLGLLLAGLALAQSQNPFDQYFSYTKTTALTAATEVITVQGVAARNKSIKLISAYIFSDAACTISLERSGTVASTTAGTVVALNPNNVFLNTSVANVYRSSNVGTGSVIASYPVQAGTDKTIDLTKFSLPAGVLDNITLRTASCTANVTIQFTWQEL